MGDAVNNAASDASLNLSPGQIALQRFWRRPSARIGVGLLLFFYLAAVYAPLFVGDVAVLWVDADGLSLPFLMDLLNSRHYPGYHDLLFNVFMLTAPLSWRRMVGAAGLATGIAAYSPGQVAVDWFDGAIVCGFGGALDGAGGLARSATDRCDVAALPGADQSTSSAVRGAIRNASE